MADKQHLVHTLEDPTLGGVAPAKKSSGDAPGIGSNVMTYIDNAGNLVFPKLDSAGNIPTAPASGVIKEDLGNTLAGNQGTDVQTAVITLTPVTDYKKPRIIVASTKTVLWKLVQHNDTVDTILAEMITGAGHFSLNELFEKIEITSGAANVQELRLFGNQIQGDNSDLHAGLQVEEF